MSVVVFVFWLKKDLNSQLCSDLSIEVSIGSTKILLSCLYRSINYSREESLLFNNHLDSAFKSRQCQVLVCGDFNFSEINWIRPTHEVNSSHENASQLFYNTVQDLIFFYFFIFANM